MIKKNKILELLIKLGISDNKSFKKYSHNVRDKKDIYALKCTKSGVIILNTTEHIKTKYYEDKDDLSYWNAEEIKQAKLFGYEDNIRRAKQIRSLIINKNWLDFGTGLGGILDILSKYSKNTYAVELQGFSREKLISEGYNVYKTLKEISFDVVTLFHVFEHLIYPIKTLKSIYKKMNSGGKIIIEVPHTNDFLLSFLDLNSFKKFTLWSEHLILHTRKSLEAFLKASGFKNIIIKGYQRYPLSNHLYWLHNNKPSGHIKWNFLNNKDINSAYRRLMVSIDKFDTLIAYAEK